MKTTQVDEKRGIPSLDGLRAVSIALVFVFHVSGTIGFPRSAPHWLTWHGVLGVQVFFSISGFLITRLLLEERHRLGRLDLALFYARRALRLCPALYVYLIAVLGFKLSGVYVIPSSLFLHAITYTVNFVHAGKLFGHLWSLSVEEQFYAVWPLIVQFLRPSRWTVTAIMVIAGGPLFLGLFFLWHPLPASNTDVTKWFPLCADSMAVGCLIALHMERLAANRTLQRFLTSPIGLGVPIAILAIDCCRDRPRIFYPIAEWAIDLGIAYLLLRLVLFPGLDAMGRFLNLRIVRRIGVLSYSLYVWQQPFLFTPQPKPWNQFPVNVLCAIAAGLTSYYVIEKPFLRLRSRLPRLMGRRSAQAVA